MTPVSLDMGTPPKLFDSSGSYKEFQVRTGNIVLPVIRVAQGLAPSSSSSGECGAGDP
jgi:hypothetical protein